MAGHIQPVLTILRRKEVEARTGLSRSSIYALIREGKFPAQVAIGGGRAVGWVAAEIDAYIAQRIADRDNPGQGGHRNANQ
jgi:prophage regulatory protein